MNEEREGYGERKGLDIKEGRDGFGERKGRI